MLKKILLFLIMLCVFLGLFVGCSSTVPLFIVNKTKLFTEIPKDEISNIVVQEAFVFSSLIAPLIGLAGSALGLIGSSKASKTSQNIANQNLEQQKSTQQIQWEREDSAFQRAAADLQKAGLSKTLAAGTPAPTGSPVVPQNTYDPNMAFSNQLAAINTATSFMKSVAETKNIEADTDNKGIENEILQAEAYCKGIEASYSKEIQELNIKEKLSNLNLNEKNIEFVSQNIEKVAKEMLYMDKQFEKLDADIKNAMIDYTAKQLEIEISRYDYDYAVSNGTRSGGADSKIGKLASDFVGVGRKASKDLVSNVKEIVSDIGAVGKKLSLSNWKK